jgi:hypothetical protein
MLFTCGEAVFVAGLVHDLGCVQEGFGALGDLQHQFALGAKLGPELVEFLFALGRDLGLELVEFLFALGRDLGLELVEFLFALGRDLGLELAVFTVAENSPPQNSGAIDADGPG